MTPIRDVMIGDSFVRVSGEGFPLVFVHGFTTTSEFWTELLPFLVNVTLSSSIVVTHQVALTFKQWLAPIAGIGHGQSVLESSSENHPQHQNRKRRQHDEPPP